MNLKIGVKQTKDDFDTAFATLKTTDEIVDALEDLCGKFTKHDDPTRVAFLASNSLSVILENMALNPPDDSYCLRFLRLMQHFLVGDYRLHEDIWQGLSSLTKGTTLFLM